MKEKDEEKERLPKKAAPLEMGMRKDGKSNVAIPPETIAALREEREQGATFEDLADKYDLAINTVRKYCADVVTIPQRQLAEKRLAVAAEKGIITTHTQRVAADAKQRDEEATSVGDNIIKTVEGYVKDEIAKKLAGGSSSISEIKEMLLLQYMGEMFTGGGGRGQQPSIIQEMRAENDRQRQFYEDKLKDQETKIREMVFEKKIQTMEEKQAGTEEMLLNRLDDIEGKIEEYRSIPSNATTEQKQDAVSHLEALGNDIERIKSALLKLGVVSPPSGTKAVTGIEAYKKQDGTIDHVLYFGDLVTENVKTLAEAITKKTPAGGGFVETPPPATSAPPPPPGKLTVQFELTEEEYAKMLLNKPTLTVTEKTWLEQYAIERAPRPRMEAAVQPAPAPAPAEQPALPEQPVDEQPKKGMLEKIKEQEEEEIRRAQGL